MQKLTIAGRLPGYNELSNGRNYHVRHRVKQAAMDIVGREIKRQRIKPVEGKVIITITCYEPNLRRDPSNVRAGAEKIILDALQNSGIIKNDNWRWLCDKPAEVLLDRQKARIEITIGD